MESIDQQKTLPLKKRRYAVSFHFEEQQEESVKTTSFSLPLKRECPQNDQLQEFFNPPPNKRFCSEKAKESKNLVASDDHLNALFNYIRAKFLAESGPELGNRVEEKYAEKKKREMMKKKRGLGLGWKSGWKKFKREKIMPGKEKVKALFGHYLTGNDEDDTFKWEIEHFTDPLVLPFLSTRSKINC